MVDNARARRLAKRIAAIVATELEHAVKDPRLAMVTITAATVTPDLRDATVYYTVYGDADEVTGSAAALASATGVLRTAVGRQTGVRFTPTLVFKPDAVPEAADKINELLAAARAADAAVAAQAAGASYAGEADPYKAPRPIDDDEQIDGEQLDGDAGGHGDTAFGPGGADGADGADGAEFESDGADGAAAAPSSVLPVR